MALMMRYEWDGVTPEQYDAVRAGVGWLKDPPEGGRVHVAAFTEAGLRITDVWDSIEAFETFANDRLLPVIQQVGVQGEPRIEFLPLHEVYCPVPDAVLLTPAV